MTPLPVFVSLSLTLLLTPGPTNTVLAVGGATHGLRRALPLVPAELCGYLLAIHILAFSIGPFVQQAPLAQAALRLLLALYLLWLAVRLWRAGSPGLPQMAVTPARVFTVTLLNPKAMIFTFVILPPLAGGQWHAALPRLAALSAMIVLASLCWISLGAAIRDGRIVRISPLLVRRAASVALLLFAVLVGLPGLMSR